jgi:hypothetical protein
VAFTTIGMLMLLGPAAALSDTGRSDVILAGSQSQVDYHAEAAAARPAAGGATIIGGNIQITSDRGARGGLAGACDPDPRFGTHPRPEDDGCGWAVPAGTGQDFVSFGRQIQNDLPTEDGGLANDTDTSPDGAFVPVATPTRERFNGRGGLDRDSTLFIENRYVLDDEDLNFRIRSTDISSYLAPEGNADNRWRRLCGTGVVEQFDNNAPVADPFAASVGKTRAFVIQVWDADFKDPSDADGGNQDYYIVDVFKADTTFDVATCQPARNDDNPPPPPPPPDCVTGCDNPDTPVVPAAPVVPVVPAAPVVRAPVATPASGVEAARAVAPGRARIAGARACPVRAFSVRVTGRSIRRVTFTVDGRRVGTVTRADRLGRWQMRIDPRRLRSGTHRVVARVQFVSGAGPARTLRTSFRICARPAAQTAPSFTG